MEMRRFVAPFRQMRPGLARTSLLVLTGLSGGLAVTPALCDIVTLTQTMRVTFAPAAKVSVPSSVNLITSGAAFSPYTASFTVSYKARTSAAGAGAQLTVQGTADFTPAGGPRIANGNLSMTCSGATLGTACSSIQTLSTTSQTSVVAIPPSACTGGGGACSPSNPNTVNLNLSLDNDPAYSTGSYTGVLTFTISAT